MLPSVRLTEIDDMLAQITPGDWRWVDSYRLEAVGRKPDDVERAHSEWSDVSMNILSGARGQANRRFLAAAPAIVHELRDHYVHITHKFDALIAAVFAEDDATRDRILARAKQLEAES